MLIWAAYRLVRGASSSDGFELIFVAVFVLWGTLGSVVVRKASGHAVGWILLLLGAVAGVTMTAEVLGAGAGAADNEWRSALAWMGTWMGDTVPPFLITMLLLYFPAGLLRTRLERVTAALAIFVYGFGALTIAFAPGRLPGHSFENPFGVEAFERLAGIGDDVFADGPGLLIVFALAMATIVVRFRRSRGDERQQMKWLVLAASALLLLLIAGFIFPSGAEARTAEAVSGALFVVVFAGFAVAIAIAILRYRLYDIDLVINRALVYSVLTAVLVGVYVALVFGFQSVMAPFTAESDLAIAGSTLAVAALFRPLRSRVQGLIDRRFYRRKFDAQRTLDAFSEHLRDEVDLGALSSRLELVVSETMQPAHVSLWLRGAS
jgi:hypothetical protein